MSSIIASLSWFMLYRPLRDSRSQSLTNRFSYDASLGNEARLLLAGFLVEGIEQFLGIGEARTTRLHGRAGRFDRGARLGVGHLQLERQGMVLGDPRKRHADHIGNRQPQLG